MFFFEGEKLKIFILAGPTLFELIEVIEIF